MPAGVDASDAPLTVVLGSETYLPDANGAAYFVDRLAGALAARGHDVHIVCPEAATTAPDHRPDAAVHRVTSLPLPGYAQVRVAAPRPVGRQLRAILGELRPDVVHVQNHFVLGRRMIAVARSLNIPVVATNHFLPENFTAFARYAPALGLRAIERGLWWDLQRVYRRAAVVTAPTPYAAILTETRAGLNEVSAVSCGVDLDRFASAGGASAFRAAYGISERPTLLHVGRLDPDKHVDQLIYALELVRREVDAQLVVVGRGHELERLRRLAHSRGLHRHVHFCGFVADNDLAGAYEAADVYCNAGTAELQSLATLEAMAAGKPVLLADAHALPLLVRDGLNGHLFRVGETTDLAIRLVELLGAPERCRAMGRNSLAIVQAHDLRTTARTFAALYREAGARTPRRASKRPSFLVSMCSRLPGQGHS